MILIADNEPDLILITEVIPKTYTSCMSSSRVDIPDYFRYSNFDSDAEQVADMRGICVYVSSALMSTEVQFSTLSFLESLWIKMILRGSNSILVGCVYCSPSFGLEGSTNSVCQLL